MAAAVAAECARDHGQFDRFSKELFSRQGNMGEKAINQAARSVFSSSEMDLYRDCTDNQDSLHLVLSDRRLGRELGFDGTPTIVINRKVIPGLVSYGVLSSFVEKELEGV